MKVLTRYLLRAHLGPFLFAFAALTGVILINTLARQLAELAGKGLPMDIIARFFLLSLPSNIALTLPMAVLVAVLYTFSQMTAENEVMALKASGVDLKRMVLPLLVVAALIAGGMVWFNDRVLPESNHLWRQLMVDISRKSPLFVLREGTLNRIESGDGTARYYLQARRIEPATNRLWDVVIYDLSDPRQRRTIYADSGRMAFNESRTDLLLTLYDGQLREIDFDQPRNFQNVDFGEQLLRMQGIGNELEREAGGGYRGDREMTVAMLNARIDTLRAELVSAHESSIASAEADLDRVLGNVPADRAAALALPPSAGIDNSEPGIAAGVVRELRLAAQREAGLERQIREYRVEVQKKYSIAAATLVFVLIGVPLALRFPRGGIGMVIAFSLTIFALYYVGLIGGEGLADRGYVPPGWAMWAMNAVMAALGLFGLSRIGRETSTTRGGGSFEWLERLRGRLRRPRRAPEPARGEAGA
jgi:lipopolysaccharide export system permease protein